MASRSPTRVVPFFNYPAVFTSDEDKLVKTFREVCRRGAFILQNDLASFEHQVAEYVGAKHVVGMANATDALHFAVRAAGIGPGDEVIFCSHTMVATPASVHFAGATPVPVECGPDHLIDPASVAAAVTCRTKAIIPTHLNGRVADMGALQEIADRHNLIIIEDAAQALGARYKGKCAGTFGVAGCVSFYPAKTLGCLGDGGCLIVNDDDIYETVRLMRDHGRSDSGDVVIWGLNSRLDNLQAAILNVKMRSYAGQVARRRALASIYDDQLKEVDGLRLPPAPESNPDHFDIFQNYEIEADNRDQLRAYLESNGVGTLIQWGGKAVHQFPKLGFSGHLPYTEGLFKRLLLLPLNTSLSDEDVAYVCGCIKRFYASHAACAA
jgi:dTDP-4-amino-4,6-dideoxygalactose transaminase